MTDGERYRQTTTETRDKKPVSRFTKVLRWIVKPSKDSKKDRVNA